MQNKNLKTWINSNLVIMLYDFAAEGVCNLLIYNEAADVKAAWKCLFQYMLALVSLFVILSPYQFLGIENYGQFYLFLGFLHFSFLSIGCIYQLNQEK